MLTDEQKQILSRCYRLLLSLPDRQEGVCRESNENYDKTGEEGGLDSVSSPAQEEPTQKAGSRSIAEE